MRISSAIILFFMICSISFAQSSFYLDREGWCKDIEIPFVIYNETQWNEREDIEDDEDRNFSELDISVTIYNGPFNIGEPFFEKEFKKTRKPSFSLTFTEEKPYLIKIQAETGNFSKYEETLEILECNIKKNNKDKRHNFSLEFENNILIEFKNSSIENKSEIVFQKINNTEFNLEKDYKIYSISSTSNFSGEIMLTLPYNTSSISEPKIFFIEEGDNSPKPFSTYTKEEETIIIETTSLGIYAILQEEEEEEIINTEEEIVEENIEEMIKPEENLEENSSTLDIVNWIIIGIFLMIIVIFAPKLFSSKTQKQLFHEERNKQTKQQISSSKEAYAKTKEYVQKYKNQYSREAIEKSLKTSRVSEEIIQLVFSEEY